MRPRPHTKKIINKTLFDMQAVKSDNLKIDTITRVLLVKIPTSGCLHCGHHSTLKVVVQYQLPPLILEFLGKWFDAQTKDRKPTRKTFAMDIFPSAVYKIHDSIRCMHPTAHILTAHAWPGFSIACPSSVQFNKLMDLFQCCDAAIKYTKRAK